MRTLPECYAEFAPPALGNEGNRGSVTSPHHLTSEIQTGQRRGQARIYIVFGMVTTGEPYS